MHARYGINTPNGLQNHSKVMALTEDSLKLAIDCLNIGRTANIRTVSGCSAQQMGRLPADFYQKSLNG